MDQKSADASGYLVTAVVVIMAVGLGAYFMSADFTAVRFTSERQRSVSAMVPGGMPPLLTAPGQPASFGGKTY